MTLARFRADPSRVRIGVRRCGAWWDVRIFGGVHIVTQRCKSARKALVRALRLADECGMPGIDLHMQWAYNHPQGRR